MFSKLENGMQREERRWVRGEESGVSQHRPSGEVVVETLHFTLESLGLSYYRALLYSQTATQRRGHVQTALSVVAERFGNKGSF